MYRRLFTSLLVLQLLVTVGLFAQDKATVPMKLINYPDLIIHNAKIVTMDDLTPTGPPGKTFQAMAVKKDRVQFLGTNAEILDLAGPQTKKMDMKGRVVIPGMIDTHIHLHEGFLNDWIRDNPSEVLRYMKNFRVQGKT